MSDSPLPKRRRHSAAGAVIEALGYGGCDAVILGCTGIPLLVAEGDTPLPSLDSTRILARAALREAARPTPA